MKHRAMNCVGFVIMFYKRFGEYDIGRHQPLRKTVLEFGSML